MTPRTPPERESIAKRLIATRRGAGFANQRALSEASGVRQSTIADIEAGRTARPRGDTLERLARALGVPIERLLLAGEAHDGLRGRASGDATTDPHARVRGALIAHRTDVPECHLTDDGRQHVRLRVTEASGGGLGVQVGDLLILDLGGVVGLDHLAAYVSIDEPEPFSTFHIRWRIGAGASHWTLRPTKRVGLLGRNAPFGSSIDETSGAFRAVGPIIHLCRSYPQPMA